MIDAHLHVWRLDRGDYDWLADEAPAIQRDFTLDDWAEAAALTPVDAVVIVQAAPTEAETAFVLEVAASAPDRVLGVVGWVDLEAADAADRVAAFGRQPAAVAVRPWLQAIADPDWILRPDVDRALGALEEAGLAYEALVKPVHLPRIAEVARRHPGLRVVVDHGAKPDIAADAFEPWATDLRRVADASELVVCKVSGLLTEAGTRTDDAALRPYVEAILDAFPGPRVLWGSDWPVVTSVVAYADWFRTAAALVPADRHADVFDGTARAVYRLDAARTPEGSLR